MKKSMSESKIKTINNNSMKKPAPQKRIKKSP